MDNSERKHIENELHKLEKSFKVVLQEFLDIQHGLSQLRRTIKKKEYTK